MVGGCDTFYLKCWVNPDGTKSPIFESIFARSASAVTSNAKISINTNRNSTTRFPVSLRRLSYVVPKSP